MKLIIIFICTSFTFNLLAQPCTNLGQNPETAFPVCGTNIFTQSSVTSCGNKPVPNPTCTATLTDVGPYWYKFTCFTSGTLHFKITPNSTSDDYDWQVFDVTNKLPSSVYTDVTTVVASNWSGEKGVTGASPAGNIQYVCDGLGKPLFSKPVNLIQGRNYLLLVSNFSNSQQGYKLDFDGGSAVITDPTPPKLKFLSVSCDGKTLKLRLNKKMKCNSVAINGSDFFVTAPGINVNATAAPSCVSGFDTDSLILTLDNVLPIGTWQLKAKLGTDGNTIVDNCDVGIPLNDSLAFTYIIPTPTPMDSILPRKCAPDELVLFFKKPIKCSSINTDGSNFTIAGTYPVSVIGASGNCVNNGVDLVSDNIILKLNTPLYTAGNFTITLVIGNNGGTIIDECNQGTPPGSTISFNNKDTVNADFLGVKRYGCLLDTIYTFHNGNNGVNKWEWFVNNSFISNLQNPTLTFNVFDTKNVLLTVSNEQCTDSSSQTIILTNNLSADFLIDSFICPEDPLIIKDASLGIKLIHDWNMGQGSTFNTVTPPPFNYPKIFADIPYTITHKVIDSIGCKKTVSKNVLVVKTCRVSVPNVFTPNGDGLNDYFYSLYAIKTKDLKLRVFDRWGKQMFEANNWLARWDGTLKGSPASAGTYVWVLQYTDNITGKFVSQKGTVILLR